MNSSHKSLIRRYLIWAYKTTRESFERIERKSTQLLVDEYLLKALEKNTKEANRKAYQVQIGGFKQYITNKRQEELKQKFADTKGKIYHPEYLYLRNRLEAIKKAIKHFLGPKELEKIEVLFDEEFIRRILQSKEH